MVTSRFYVTSVTRLAYNPAHAKIELKPAYRGEENKAWSEATPSGEITLQISNPSAVEWFSSRLGGGDIAVTFDDAPHAELV